MIAPNTFLNMNPVPEYQIKKNPSTYCYAISSYYALISVINKNPMLGALNEVIQSVGQPEVEFDKFVSMYYEHQGPDDPTYFLSSLADNKLFNLSFYSFQANRNGIIPDIVVSRYTDKTEVVQDGHTYRLAAGLYYGNFHWMSVVQEQGNFYCFNDSATPIKITANSLPSSFEYPGYDKEFQCIHLLFVRMAVMDD